MKASERIVVIRRTAAELAVLTEGQADVILRTTGSYKLTPGGFDGLSHDDRIRALYDILGAADEHVLLSLAAALAPESSWAFRVADHLVTLPATERAFLLGQVGIDVLIADEVIASFPADAQRRVILQLMNGDEQVIDALYEALQDEIGGDLPSPATAPGPAAGSPPTAPDAVDDTHPEPPPVPSSADSDGPIFVVHGHDRAILHELVRVLERGTGRDVAVLHEQANNGAVLLEKFEGHAARAAYAVVLVTGDDRGGPAASDEQRPRGRQNVVFELGYFFAKLGRKRVTVLLEDGVEEPSDIKGFVYTTLDPGGGWKRELGRELRSAGVPFDDSRVP